MCSAWQKKAKLTEQIAEQTAHRTKILYVIMLSMVLPRQYAGTHWGQILFAKPFEGGTDHMGWMELNCLVRDKVLLEIEVLAMVSGIHLVVGETLIAQHDWGCRDT